MYHEEKIIDGVLCWRGIPNGTWIRYNSAQLTERLVAVERHNQELRTFIKED